MSDITFEQFARGIAAIEQYRVLVHTIARAFSEAGEERIDSLGGGGVCNELRRQLEERCGDEADGYGTMVEYMLYERGRCVTADGVEMVVDSPEALWRWWEITESGPFTRSAPF